MSRRLAEKRRREEAREAAASSKTKAKKEQSYPNCECEPDGETGIACDVCARVFCPEHDADKVLFCEECGEANTNQYCPSCVEAHDHEDFL